jgi:formamidopyrimidine-DNA glycosylase
MPELPEVETYVHDLQVRLKGRTVTRSVALWPRTIAAPSVEHFTAIVIGQRFANFTRRGKYMLLTMDSGAILIIHLRMTGKCLIRTAGEPVDRHTRVLFELDDGYRLDFVDSRKFGRVWLVDDASGVVGKLGPEPLSETFTDDYLARRLAGRSAAVKSLLLDQGIVAGVGNIYADEALHAAGIHPQRAGDDLTADEIGILRRAVQEVLRRAIALGGSSLGDSPVQNYLRPGGETGEFQHEHQVYGRAGLPCLQCGEIIQRAVIGQRSAHYCPVCQR